MNGGKLLGVGVLWGSVLGGCGRWRRRKRVEVGVRKQDMWVEANWSIRFRYLCLALAYVGKEMWWEEKRTSGYWSTASHPRSPSCCAR